MSTLILSTARDPVQATEDDVRSTLDPVQPENPPAEMAEAPEYNEQATYPYNALGLATHTVTGPTTPSERYLPWHAARAENTDYAVLINEQVSTSGTAAARERAGMWGHGTGQRTETMEPQIRDGSEFGADYFAAHVVGANPTGGAYMGSQISENQATAVAAAFAGDASHRAAQSTLYGAWLVGDS